MKENKNIIKLALQADLINYVDNETPKSYFISADADIKNVVEFAKLIIEQCGNIADNYVDHGILSYPIGKHFGV